MAERWDNIDILRGIDRYQQETYHGGPLRTVNGQLLMQYLTGAYVHDHQQVRGFIQELHIARDLGLLTFDVQLSPCYRPRYLNIQRLNYLGTIRHSSARIAGNLIT